MVYLFKGGFLLTGSDVVLAFLSLGLSVLIAAYVPKETYGIYRYIIAIANTVVIFSLTGMNSAVSRAVALGREGVFQKSLSVQFRYAVLQFTAAAAVGTYYLVQGNTTYTIAFFIIAVVAPISGVLNTYVAYLTGKKDFVRVASWKIQSGIVSTAAMAAVVLNSPTIISLIIAYFVSALITNTWFLWRTFHLYKPSGAYNEEDISYGKHLSVMNNVNILASQLDSILIYHLLGPVSLAIYSFAVLIPERLRALLGFLPNIALPRIAGRSREELRGTVQHRMTLTLIGTLAMAIAYAATAPLFFSIFFPQYLEAVPYTMAAGLFLLVAAPGYLNTILTAEGSYRALYYVSLSTPILKIVMSVIFIILFGIWGAIAARLIAAAFQGTLSYLFINHVPSLKGKA